MGRRRTVATVAALVLTLEAVVLVLINLFLGKVVSEQEMSLAGIDPRAMTASTWVGAVVVGAYVCGCAVILGRTAIRDVPPRGFLRIVLISCAVVHGLLGAFSIGLVGWTAFLVLMAVLALIVWSLTWYPVPPERARTPAEELSPSGA
ncbi:hypothetical protein [Streptomyces iconiensis]|uniref:Integral membrane protein n=1 Tax=Streptomyces iconiensis TaxID=1384038 RepID=A0ABT7AB27_9ACTN|nr:hypothetical protein [Streptomyces iconiensis]MDJ1138516.1 hypothetical protein [Streptomyces iconiensis]